MNKLSISQSVSIKQSVNEWFNQPINPIISQPITKQQSTKHFINQPAHQTSCQPIVGVSINQSQWLPIGKIFDSPVCSADFVPGWQISPFFDQIGHLILFRSDGASSACSSLCPSTSCDVPTASLHDDAGSSMCPQGQEVQCEEAAAYLCHASLSGCCRHRDGANSYPLW